MEKQVLKRHFKKWTMKVIIFLFANKAYTHSMMLKRKISTKLCKISKQILHAFVKKKGMTVRIKQLSSLTVLAMEALIRIPKTPLSRKKKKNALKIKSNRERAIYILWTGKRFSLMKWWSSGKNGRMLLLLACLTVAEVLKTWATNQKKKKMI